MKALEPRVSIGLPTYNRPDLLSLVLEAFRQQTFSQFELIISDNASPNPEVRKLCEHYANIDARFRYVRQPVNQGAEKNFWFVYDQARAPLFLWASDDDLWPADFLERGVRALEGKPNASAWFCQVVNINMRGEVVREYPSFKRFQSTILKPLDLIRFLWEPEIMGKANLIYSIFRRQALARIVDIFRERPPTWGNDMNLVYGYLCRYNLIVDDQLTLQKRVPIEVVDSVPIPRSQIYPREEREVYFESYRCAAAGSGYRLFTAAVLAARSAYDYAASGRAATDYENSDFEDWRLRTLRDFENWKAHVSGFAMRNLARIRARLPGSWGGK
ncbi:glycosyltransferase family A protein [Bradyrhizobium vignae]|uniref:glycosyltransferase family 2 protein n=1 Tax=Bradyrhizobium TaxID=374 RepID=UPI00100B455D|nr:glycosyltransferase family A protein [Bradyrhizobium vignae]RXH01609.1 glycosyltransferase family 2 protein [Bradyrhizobium vignae]